MMGSLVILLIITAGVAFLTYYLYTSCTFGHAWVEHLDGDVRTCIRCGSCQINTPDGWRDARRNEE